MRLPLTIWLLFSAGLVSSQSRVQGYTASSKKIKSEEITDPLLLSQMLTVNTPGNKEKAIAIFRWITENISYRTAVIRVRKKSEHLQRLEDADDTAPLRPLNDRVATKVLEDKQTVCEGYARLFKSLCDHAGLQAAIITGYARTGWGSGGASKFKSNHSWNAVYFDSAWHLLDAAWASGHISMPSGEFVREYDSRYFMSPPRQFIRDHYPDDLRWSLLQNPPTIDEFRSAPFRQRSFVKYGISSFYPEKGIIDAIAGDTITLTIKTGRLAGDFDIAPDTLWDKSSLHQSPVIAYVFPEMKKDNTTVYRYAVQSETTEWLYIMYNNDAVLRYKLNIRKNDTRMVKE